MQMAEWRQILIQIRGRWAYKWNLEIIIHILAVSYIFFFKFKVNLDSFKRQNIFLRNILMYYRTHAIKTRSWFSDALGKNACGDLADLAFLYKNPPKMALLLVKVADPRIMNGKWTKETQKIGHIGQFGYIIASKLM